MKGCHGSIQGRLYEMKEQKLDKLIDNLNRNINIILENKKHNLEISINKAKLINPLSIINTNENKLKELITNLNNIIDKKLSNERHNLEYIINTLKLVNPLNILSNGYSLVKLNDKVIKSSKELKENDKINIKLHDGEVIGIVKEIK